MMRRKSDMKDAPIPRESRRPNLSIPTKMLVEEETGTSQSRARVATREGVDSQGRGGDNLYDSVL